MLQARAGPVRSWVLPTSGFLTWVQDSKHLSHHPLLLFLAINKELDKKWRSWDLNWNPPICDADGIKSSFTLHLLHVKAKRETAGRRGPPLVAEWLLLQPW